MQATESITRLAPVGFIEEDHITVSSGFRDEYGRLAGWIGWICSLDPTRMIQ
jgi:hypothetical protein